MRTDTIHHHHFTEAGKPAGGQTFGPGFTIAWQRGPLGRDAGRKAPNGAFVEDVLTAVLMRIDFYQASEFACEENAEAMSHIAKALDALDRRTREREARGVEGTHAV